MSGLHFDMRGLALEFACLLYATEGIQFRNVNSQKRSSQILIFFEQILNDSQLYLS